MSVRSFTSMKTRIMRVAGMDANDGELSSVVEDFINRSYVDICRRYNWSWLEVEGGFNTVAPHSTGTIDGTADSTGISANTTTSFTSAQVGYFLQIDSLGQEIHKIASIDSTSSLTLTTPISATVTASTYLIFKTDYALDQKVDPSTIMYLTETNTSTELQYVDQLQLEDVVPNLGAISQTSPPRIWSVSGVDSTGNTVVRLYPIPSAAVFIKYRAMAVVTLMATGNDIPLLPERFQDVIENGALALTYTLQGRPALAQTYTALFEASVKTMIGAENRRSTYHYPREENDLPRLKMGPGLKLPPAYGGTKV